VPGPILIEEDKVTRIYEKQSESYAAFAARMSELCRYIWAGSLAAFFSLLLAAEGTRAFKFYTDNKSLLLAVVIMSSAALLLDYVQSWAGFRTAKSVIDWVENSSRYTRASYLVAIDSPWIKLNVFCFALKNICAILAAILLGYAVWSFVRV
jgi:hypothetical protein